MKKRFLQNKKNSRKNINDPNEINTSVQIPCYGPNQRLSPREYMLSPDFVNLENTFEERCRYFLSKANPDEFNGSYMDAVIECMGAEAAKYIAVQRADHINVIKRALHDMHIGDKIKCEAKLLQYRNSIEWVQNELIRLKKIYQRGTSYEEI